MNASEIAKALGGHRNGQGYLCRCPVPAHGRGKGDRTPSLSIADGRDGKLLVRCFAGCGPLDVLAELRKRGMNDRSDAGTLETSRRRENLSTPVADPEPHERALAIWRSAVPAAGTLVETYLRSRGIVIDAPASIRFAPSCTYLPRVAFPAMIAAVQGPDRRVIAVQVTALKHDGSAKADVATPRKTIGLLGRGAVRLGPSDTAIGLAEGVETALSVQQMLGITVWASLGAARLHAVHIPDSVRTVDIYGDPDEPGRRAVEKALAVHRLGRTALGKLPPRGDDWNDFMVMGALQSC